MNKENKIITHLEAAIAAHQKGLSLFDNNDYSSIPKDREQEIRNTLKYKLM